LWVASGSGPAAGGVSAFGLRPGAVMMTDQVSPGVIASAVSVGHVVVEEAADGWGSGTVGPTEERRTTRGSVRKGGRGGARNSSHHHPFGASIVCSSEESAVVPHEALRSYPWGRSGEGRYIESRAEEGRSTELRGQSARNHGSPPFADWPAFWKILSRSEEGVMELANE
jgi:hypothetical protein